MIPKYNNCSYDKKILTINSTDKIIPLFYDNSIYVLEEYSVENIKYNFYFFKIKTRKQQFTIKIKINDISTNFKCERHVQLKHKDYLSILNLNNYNESINDLINFMKLLKIEQNKLENLNKLNGISKLCKMLTYMALSYDEIGEYVITVEELIHFRNIIYQLIKKYY